MMTEKDLIEIRDREDALTRERALRDARKTGLAGFWYLAALVPLFAYVATFGGSRAAVRGAALLFATAATCFGTWILVRWGRR